MALRIRPQAVKETTTMKTTKLAVLITHASIIKKYNGNWSYASQQTVLNLLKTCHDTVIKRRQLGYHLADLREEGLIKTIKRSKRNEDGTLCLLSSATCLTMKGCVFLYRLGLTWAMQHLNKLRNKYLPPSNTHKKRETAERNQASSPLRPKNNPFLDPVFRQQVGLEPAPAYLTTK